MNKKSAFSYLELIICMSLVTAVIMLAMPSTTRTAHTTDVYGEYRCFAEFVDGEWKLFQQERINSSTFSEKTQASNQECSFKPLAGITNYTVTVVGGGADGSAPRSLAESEASGNQDDYDGFKIVSKTNGDIKSCPQGVNTTITYQGVEDLDFNSSKYCKTYKQTFPILQGIGGRRGKAVTAVRTINNELKIRKCNAQTNNFPCVGNNEKKSAFDANTVADGATSSSDIKRLMDLSITPYNSSFYVLDGENGEADVTIDGNIGGLGGSCQCEGSKCLFCDGKNGTGIGAGGGGGSFAFKTNLKLNDYYKVIPKIGANYAYSASKDYGNRIGKIEKSDDHESIPNFGYHYGVGGKGSGGGIIIKW